MKRFCHHPRNNCYRFSTLLISLTVFCCIIWNVGSLALEDCSKANKPWYLINGKRYPQPAAISNITGIRVPKLLPYEDIGNDRILNQLMFVPPNYDAIKKSGKIKTILVYNAADWWKLNVTKDVFKNNCPVDTCKITLNTNERGTVDMVLFNDRYVHTNGVRSPNQIYAIHHKESPLHTEPFEYPDVFNWTITYRQDSTIVTPYGKWVYHDSTVKQQRRHRNYAVNKSKKVAWFVSNCKAKNNRYKYAEELQKYIQVDIYGECGSMTCPHSEEKKCYEMLDKDYKFYLAFENSNCKDYITEKLFRNSLNHNVVPIVMGPPPENYEKYTPLRSYIHADHFMSPKELAEYLHVLDQNDDLYNFYFKWKGTGEFLSLMAARFWCQVCAMLHDDHAISSKHWYKDINRWWRGPGICTV